MLHRRVTTVRALRRWNMTRSVAARIGSLALLLGLTRVGLAEDVDIFGQPPNVTVGAPNILFILDNSANWSKASQKWPTPTMPGAPALSTQGEAELWAIKNLVNGLTKPANVGIMMLTETGQYGGYVRFGMRPMLTGGA